MKFRLNPAPFTAHPGTRRETGPANRSAVFGQQSPLRPWPSRASLLIVLCVLAAALTGCSPFRNHSAGIGRDDRPSLPDYSVKLVFATQSGSYLADITVTVLNEAGRNLARLHSEGPWLFIDLPPGSYKVLARRNDGSKKEARLHVGSGKQQVLTLTWPDYKKP